MFAKSPRKSLLVYPEGHRMYEARSVDVAKLKTGMIRYAYSRQIPVQLGMSFGNENVMYEKRMEFNFGQKVFYRLGEVINPADFEDEAVFLERVKLRFAEYFEESYKMIPEGGLNVSTTKKND